MKAFAIALFLAAASPAFGGAISEFHATQTNKASTGPHNVDPIPLHPPRIKLASFNAATNQGVVEIGIERTACFGTCPVYTFVASSDGTCQYEGTQYVERTGYFTGKIPVAEFTKLAKLIKQSRFMDLDKDYLANVTDNPSVYTMVVMDGHRKSVMDYANAGPAKLQAIEKQIDALMAKAVWDEPQKAEEKK